MQRAWRLRGRVGESERSFFLSRGKLRCGAAEDNDIRLPVPGVSRHHACFLCSAAGLELEDLGSKNGSTVNGAPISRSRLEAGDRVGLGPVELVVEPVHPRDLELAIALDEAPALPPSAGERTTRTVPLEGRDGGGEGFFAAVLAAVARRPEPTALVAALREALGLSGAAAVEVEGGRRVVLAASGEIDAERLSRLEPARGAGSATGEARATLGWWVEGDGAGGPLVAVGGLEGGRALCLVLAGEVATGPEVLEELRLCGGLLEVLLARREGAPAGAARRLGGGPLPADFVVGTSAAARELLAALEAIAPGDLPVLIRGETGVGKELVARAVHALSPRRGGPFVALNCAALPTDLLEAELFGIAAGVATGVRARHGRIRQAHGGTLFLDEIGDMQAPLQARLLRVLQEGELLPVGGAPERVDFRCLAATHGALEGAIAAGRFRADLYFRLAGAVLRVPSLRERREDLPLLIEHFLRRFGARRGKRLRGLTARALDLLLRHPWPGNVRELEHEVQRLVELCPDGGVIDSALLDPRFEGRSGTCGQGEEPTTLRAQLAGVERRLIEEALAACSGSQRQAALRLGISRNTLARRLRELGIPPRPDPPAQRRSSEDP